MPSFEKFLECFIDSTPRVQILSHSRKQKSAGLFEAQTFTRRFAEKRLIIMVLARNYLFAPVHLCYLLKKYRSNKDYETSVESGLELRI